jgi:hypothetical protein
MSVISLLAYMREEKETEQQGGSWMSQERGETCSMASSILPSSYVTL